MRIEIFNSIKLYILATQNEEIQIETVRVLSNLSRHHDLCNEYVEDPTFLEALTVVLDHTLRDLVFYSVGIIINITLHEDTRQKILEKENIIPKLIDVLRDSNIEDIDLSKVAAKALHNMTQMTSEKAKQDYWSNSSIKKLEEVLESLGDELDSIMVSQFHPSNPLAGRGLRVRVGRDNVASKLDKRAEQRHARADAVLPPRRVRQEV